MPAHPASAAPVPALACADQRTLSQRLLRLLRGGSSGTDSVAALASGGLHSSLRAERFITSASVSRILSQSDNQWHRGCRGRTPC